jgi:hypothetical protein
MKIERLSTREEADPTKTHVAMAASAVAAKRSEAESPLPSKPFHDWFTFAAAISIRRRRPALLQCRFATRFHRPANFNAHNHVLSCG